MEALKDLFLLAFDSVVLFNQKELYVFLSVVSCGAILGILCWFICIWYVRLWNVEFRITVVHHVLCGIAAVLTIKLTIVFACLNYTKQATEFFLEGWKLSLMSESKWEESALNKTFDKIEGLRIEDIVNYPPPDQDRGSVPLKGFEARKIFATVYATEAIEQFKKVYPYLSKVFRIDSVISPEIIENNVSSFIVKNKKLHYEKFNLVNLAHDHIQKSVDIHVNSFVNRYRAILFFLFLFVQSIPFGLVGLAAYSDLKVTN